MQVVELNVPVEFDVKVTVPVGTIAPAPEESEIVAAHEVFTLVLTAPGVQTTEVVVVLSVEASVKLPLLPV